MYRNSLGAVPMIGGWAGPSVIDADELATFQSGDYGPIPPEMAALAPGNYLAFAFVGDAADPNSMLAPEMFWLIPVDGADFKADIEALIQSLGGDAAMPPNWTVDSMVRLIYGQGMAAQEGKIYTAPSPPPPPPSTAPDAPGITSRRS